ncbi:MAG: hypothetical protein ABIR11_09900 [Candidatus Limnocylindrales bacterium]
MSPALLLFVLVASLLALLPVWRLRVAGWPSSWLLTAWVVYAIGIVVAVRFPVASRFLVPILVLAYVAPFVVGPERLTRVLRGRPAPPRPVIDVTPKPPVGLPDPDPDADDADREQPR